MMETNKNKLTVAGKEPGDPDATFESRTELKPGQRLPPPFARMFISHFLRRTDNGGWLYSVVIVEVPQ
jgi:hypothetical protein